MTGRQKAFWATTVSKESCAMLLLLVSCMSVFWPKSLMHLNLIELHNLTTIIDIS